MCSKGIDRPEVRVAVVGSGPAGLFAADLSELALPLDLLALAHPLAGVSPVDASSQLSS